MVKIHTTSAALVRDPTYKNFLGYEIVRGLNSMHPGDIIVGWGGKLTARKAALFAKEYGFPYWRLEDGFFSFFEHPTTDGRRLSLIVDETGIYYDSRRPSDIENLLNRDDWMSPALEERAEKAMALIRQWHLSKYNHAPTELSPKTRAILKKYDQAVLIVDQVHGDMSIKLGQSGIHRFHKMLEDAATAYPDAALLIKVHPDVLAGEKTGHFTDVGLPKNAYLVADDCAPQVLFKAVSHVYVATSQMGFEALIAGKQVSCYGLPFYAGWGLTKDKMGCERRQATVSLTKLFAAACIKYCRYMDPFTGERCEIEDVLDFLISAKQMPRPKARFLYALSFSPWKRGFVPAFIGAQVDYIKWIGPRNLASAIQSGRIKKGDAVLTWGRTGDDIVEGLPPYVPHWRMEDGFIRSRGLGSDMQRPASLVMDSRGIYYDGTKPSDLEYFLENHTFEDRERSRARSLLQMMLQSRVSKYNVGATGALDFKSKAGDKEIILVPGQVEGDASLEYGSPAYKTNAALLQVVRAENPDAFIVYKPHPDVVARNRQGAVPPDVLEKCTDLAVLDADIVDCMEAVDSIHTMTSQTGFEAILKGKPVTVYGMPFYAGWGLTADKLEFPRRNRQLTVEELVYGALIIYPAYICWTSGQSYSPEALTADIVRMKQSRHVHDPSWWGWVKGWGRKVRNVAEALLKWR